MPNSLALSLEGALAPSVSLTCLQRKSGTPDGWGIGFYPGGEPSASVLKEPAPPPGSIRSELIKAWDHLASSLFVLHIRSATWGGASDANTQPFCRSWGGRDWILAHSGSLERRLHTRAGAVFEPVGATDTEAVFCELLERFREQGYRSLREADPRVLRGWLSELNRGGSLTILLSDGSDLVGYADTTGKGQLWACEIRPPYRTAVMSDGDVRIDLLARGDSPRKAVVLASSPLALSAEVEARWERVAPGTLVQVRHGSFVAVELDPMAELRAAPRVAVVPKPLDDPGSIPPATYRVRHVTRYRYSAPVERSRHWIRLHPVEDAFQRVESHTLNISVAGHAHEFEDVFGNRVTHLELNAPFTELEVEAVSEVRIPRAAPYTHRPLRSRSTIPVQWMPWQYDVLQPFLLPPELPESELEELVTYARTFAERNDGDLLGTLVDITQSIHRDYHYRQGVTTVHTSPFEVYEGRVGVCQDFTNLFVTLARFIGLPARYVCGYLHLGADAENRVMAAESHAWAEVYLPDVGWRGFDPTNGCLIGNQHIRLATGRNYRDAAPMSGVIYLGGGAESLGASVEVTRVDEPG
jgi:transglutaminase-like putative cysteine protease/predicted glutamine amidotransferase